jgi:outer membrane protein OmpA-like peptidoglycan-associated protein
MVGAKVFIRRGSRDDGERPFWISFSDLMTALMVVFLLVMSVALLSVTREVTAQQKAEAQRRQEIKELLADLKKAADKDVFSGVTVHDEDLQNPYVDFGWLATFDLDKSYLSRGQARFLRLYVPEVLAVADTEKGQRWFKQVVVEGYTDKTGLYLHNLDLSLRRSERVVCVLLDNTAPAESPLSAKQKIQVRRLFLVGGYSSNSAKADAAQSRRIELKLKFWELNDSDRHLEADASDDGTGAGFCALGAE